MNDKDPGPSTVRRVNVGGRGAVPSRIPKPLNPSTMDVAAGRDVSTTPNPKPTKLPLAGEADPSTQIKIDTVRSIPPKGSTLQQRCSKDESVWDDDPGMNVIDLLMTTSFAASIAAGHPAGRESKRDGEDLTSWLTREDSIGFPEEEQMNQMTTGSNRRGHVQKRRRGRKSSESLAATLKKREEKNDHHTTTNKWTNEPMHGSSCSEKDNLCSGFWNKVWTVLTHWIYVLVAIILSLSGKKSLRASTSLHSSSSSPIISPRRFSRNEMNTKSAVDDSGKTCECSLETVYSRTSLCFEENHGGCVNFWANMESKDIKDISSGEIHRDKDDSWATNSDASSISLNNISVEMMNSFRGSVSDEWLFLVDKGGRGNEV